MLSLTYLSTATQELDAETLRQLLLDFRARNEELGLTGMLLYSGGNIIQTLEGPDETVESTFGAIARDLRHRNVMVTLREPIEERAFPDWSMGFREVDDQDVRDLPGFHEFLQDPRLSAGYGDRAEPAYTMLRVFRENTARG